MAFYRVSVASKVPAPGCHKGLVATLQRMRWDMLNVQPDKIRFREPSDDERNPKLAIIEANLTSLADNSTRIDMNASCVETGYSAQHHIRVQVESVLKKMDLGLKPVR